MDTKVNSPKKIKKPKENKDLKTIFNGLDRITAHFGLDILTKIVDKRDTPKIILFLIIGVIFLYAFPLAEKTENTLFGQPYWFIVMIFFIVVMLLAYLLSKE